MPPGPLAGPLAGASYGALFGYLFARRCGNPGAGIVRGLGYAFLLWLAIPAGILPVVREAMPSMGMVDAARAHFPQLVADVVCLGLPLGLVLGLLSVLRPRGPQLEFSFTRALVVGGLAGAIGGTVFGRWTGGWYFQLLSELLNSNTVSTGEWLHYVSSIVIGSGFGLLFQKDVQGLGSSLGWGMGYGLMWWFLGPLTLLPMVGGNSGSSPVLGMAICANRAGEMQHLPKVVNFFATLGIPAPAFSAVTISSLEFIDGIALALGFGSRFWDGCY